MTTLHRALICTLLCPLVIVNDIVEVHILTMAHAVLHSTFLILDSNP